MRKSPIIWILVMVLLSGCSLLGGNAPTAPSESEQATLVAQILTAQPTPTVPSEALPTAPLAPPIVETPVATQTPMVVTNTAQPTSAELPQATATKPAVTDAPLASPTATAVPPTATNTPLPSPTLAADDIRQGLGAPTYSDTMANGDAWPTGQDAYTAITFRDGTMLLTALTETDGWRLTTYGPVNNFYVEISGRFEACSGSDHFGLFVRVPEKSPANRGYLFGIGCDGKYRIAEWDGSIKPDGKWTTHVYWTANPAILAGPMQTNRVGVLAEGSRLTMYVNGVKLSQVDDSTFSSGWMGVFVGADATQNLTVQVDQLDLWVR
ncbi:MAG: DUF1080 domain-containing protein [Anaerolinea sp.]|nr:DUF1080 domain-containing protein [Anaerolinea sp.]